MPQLAPTIDKINVLKNYPFELGLNGIEVFGNLDGNLIRFICDSGATRSCINSKFLRAPYNTNKILRPYYGRLKAANETFLNTIGEAHFTVEFLDHKVSTNFIVVDDVQFSCILGNDFLHQQGMIIDFVSMTLSSDKLSEPIKINQLLDVSHKKTLFEALPLDHKLDSHTAEIFSYERKCLKPGEMAFIKVKILPLDFVNDQVLITFCPKLRAKLFMNDIAFADSIWTGTHNIFIRNSAPYAVMIYGGEFIGTAEPYSQAYTLEESSSLMSLSAHPDESAAASHAFSHTPQALHFYASTFLHSPTDRLPDESLYTDSLFHTSDIKTIHDLDICADLTDEERAQVLAVLEKNKDAFSWTNVDFTIADVRPCKIELTDYTPIRNRPFRYSVKEKEAIEKLINELSEAGIIRPSVSDYAANVIVVKKKDGGLRCVVDFRGLNRNCTYVSHPIPFITDILGYLESSRIYCMADIRNSFFVVPLEESSKKYTSFTCHKGLFEFNTLPQGLCTSMQLFIKTLSEALNCFIPHCLIAYCDDLIMHASTFEDMLEVLDKILTRLRVLKIKLKAQKTKLFYTKISVFGFEIDEHGVRPCPSRLRAVADIPTPTTLRELRSLVGFLGYFRSFIQGYSQVISPLTDLLKKDVDFHIGEKELQAINTAKKLLCESAGLVHFTPGSLIRIETDASLRGLGAALFILKDGKYMPVAFASRKLSNNEKNWPSTHLELLALVFATQKFRHYIFDTPFEFVVDNSPLQWIPFQTKHQSRILKLVLALQEHKFTVKHKSGKLHLGVDLLSRLPVDKPECNDDIACIENGIKTIEELDFSEEQKKDPNLRELIDALSGEPCENRVSRKCRSYVLEDGILFRKNYTTFGASRLMVVPLHLIPQILLAYHEQPYSGNHFAVLKTYRKIAEKYYFEKMKNEVSKYCASCFDCQAKKRPIRPPQGLLQPSVHEKIFSTIEIDFYGPLKPSYSNHTYIITAICAFSRFVILHPCVKANATTTADFIINQIVCLFGVPKTIVCDCDTSFKASLMQELTARLGCKMVFSTPHHHETLGIVERSHASIAQIWSMYVNENHTSWAKYVKLIQFSMNTVPNESTKMSPHYLVFGSTPQMPIDVNFSLPFEHKSNLEWLENLHRARETCKSNLNKMREQMANRYNKNRVKADYNIGSKVMIYYPQGKLGLTTKFLKKYRGPFTVMRKLSDLNYECQREINGRKITTIVHVSRMKKFHVRPAYLVTPKRKIAGPKNRLYFLDY
jgi:RNase H-like domain found in reverse transcriptase/Reverse transcriptase (RNA-dependent DNA polymerase)/Integrase zinc binding domain/Integrase core domain